MQICPNCGKENPEEFRFCGFCSATLAEPAISGEERKVVSILFVDLVGFTARSDHADPEDVRATLRPYHALLKREIERFGGTVEKFIGDAVMAVFGAPVGHEDDAERAVRAALRITEAIPELNEAHRLDLAVRAAVDTGEAVVALSARPEEGEGIVAGDVVNTASRLQQVAPVGGVVVGEVTYRTTNQAIDYEALGPVTVKGKAERIPIWLAGAARSRYVAELERAPTPFIGREEELGLLERTYARTVRESSVQLVTITGEPGVGKSRLIGEFSSWVDDRPELVFWRHGRCLPYGEGITFWALGEIVKGQAGVLESDGPDGASRKLSETVEALAREHSERDWLKARLAPLIGLSPDSGGTAEREESFTAWRTFLEDMASARPLVLVIEDLHWADEPMLEFVEHLVDWAAAVPILVVCSARPELYELRPGWGGGKRNSTTISLSPLAPEETARLVSALLSEALLPAETQGALIERSGGNPLYAEEFVRMLTDRGILERRGRAVRIAEGADIPVPETVQALIAARLDTLSPDRKALLHDASVVGKVFWSGALASMGGLGERDVREGLHELARKELVRSARTSSIEDQAEYAFWHILIGDVAYGQIPRGARAAKHRAAADWIERIAGHRVTDHAELLAHHYGLALELARAAGAAQEVEELKAAARRFLVMAGDRAMQLDVGKAEAHYRQALELMPPGHPDRARVVASAGEGAFFSGKFAEAEQSYEEAIRELRARGNALGMGQVMVSLSFLHGFRGETGKARTLLEEVIKLLEREPPGPELARAYAQIARERMLSGAPEEALEWSGKALALAERFGMPGEMVMARQFRGNARCELGDLGGLEDLREALRQSLERGLVHETVRCHINLADWVWFTEGPAPALALQRAGIEFGERRGVTGPVLWTRGETLWTLFDLGEWDELLQTADELIAWDRSRGGSYFGVMALSYRARVQLWRGEAGEASSLQEEFLPRARDIGDHQILAPALDIAAQIRHALGDLPAALDLVRELEERTRENRAFLAQNLTDPVRVCAAAGESRLARRLVEEAAELAARHRHAVLTGRAILAEAEGNAAEAADLYANAAEQWKEFGFALERGQALLGAGRCLLAIGRAGEAIDRLSAARGLFGGLDARPLVAQADDLLARATALTS